MQRQGGIFAVLGGAPSVWDDLAEVKRLVKAEGQGLGVVACNIAGIEYRGHLHGWATLHPERLHIWSDHRKGNQDFRAFVGARHSRSPDAEVIEQRWHGSSGLYAAQVALGAFQAGGVILCGVPMSPEQGHISYPTYWTGGTSYRRGFIAALPEVGGRLRSMGGWTRELFGAPTPEWIAALCGAKPVASLRPPNTPRPPMHRVKNISDSTQKIIVREPQGGFSHVLLRPGESGEFDVDPNQARYQEGGPLKAAEITEKPAAKKKPAPAKRAAKPVRPQQAPPAPTITAESSPEG